MAEREERDGGAALAGLMVAQVVLSVLLKRRVVSAAELRELMDGIALHLEQMAGSPGQERRSRAALVQLGLIVEALEIAHPEMRASPPSS